MEIEDDLEYQMQQLVIKLAHRASILGFKQLVSHQIPSSTPWPLRPEQENILFSRLMVGNFKISATYLELQAPLISLLLAQKRQGMVGTIYLFSNNSSSQLRATLILNRSEASTTKMMPSMRLAVQLAFSCQKLRYLDCPDMSNTSKSMPLRVKVCFLNPMVGVISVSNLVGSIIRESTVVLPLLSRPTSSSLPYEFPIFCFPTFYYYSNQAHQSTSIQIKVSELVHIIYYILLTLCLALQNIKV